MLCCVSKKPSAERSSESHGHNQQDFNYTSHNSNTISSNNNINGSNEKKSVGFNDSLSSSGFSSSSSSSSSSTSTSSSGGSTSQISSSATSADFSSSNSSESPTSGIASASNSETTSSSKSDLTNNFQSVDHFFIKDSNQVSLDSSDFPSVSSNRLQTFLPVVSRDKCKNLFVEGGRNQVAEDEPPVLLPCAICARTFKPESLEKHTRICERAAIKKRKPFDSAKQRIQGTELAEFLPKETVKRKNQHEEKSPGGSQKSLPSKQSHVVVTRAIAAARNDIIDGNLQSPTIAPAAGSNMTAGTVTRANEKGMCPTCNRQFGIKAYDRHVAWCKERATRVPPSPATNVAKERLEARINYRAPALKNRRMTNREKYAPGSALNIQNLASKNPSNQRPKESLSSPNCNTTINERTSNDHHGSSIQNPKSTNFGRMGQDEESVSSGPMKSRLSDRLSRPSAEFESGPNSTRSTSLRPIHPLLNLHHCPRLSLTREFFPNNSSSPVSTSRNFSEKLNKLDSTLSINSSRKNNNYSKNFNIVSARSRGNPKINDIKVNDNIFGMTVQPCDIDGNREDDKEFITWKQMSANKKLKRIDLLKLDDIFDREDFGESAQSANTKWTGRVKKLNETYLIDESMDLEISSVLDSGIQESIESASRINLSIDESVGINVRKNSEVKETSLPQFETDVNVTNSTFEDPMTNNMDQVENNTEMLSPCLSGLSKIETLDFEMEKKQDGNESLKTNSKELSGSSEIDENSLNNDIDKNILKNEMDVSENLEKSTENINNDDRKTEVSKPENMEVEKYVKEIDEKFVNKNFNSDSDYTLGNNTFPKDFYLIDTSIKKLSSENELSASNLNAKSFSDSIVTQNEISQSVNVKNIKKILKTNMNLLRNSTDALVSSLTSSGQLLGEESLKNSMENIENEIIEEINVCSAPKSPSKSETTRYQFFPDIKIHQTRERKDINVERTTIQTFHIASPNLLINLDRSKYHENKISTPKQPKLCHFPTIVSTTLGRDQKRSSDRESRQVWSSYVRRRPDFNLVLTGRTGSCKDYDPFLIAERQMNELLSDSCSEQSLTTESPTNQCRSSSSPSSASPNYPLTHSSAFVKYPDSVWHGLKEIDKRGSLIAPPSEFDDFIADLSSSDSTETNSINREILTHLENSRARDPSDDRKSKNSSSRGHILGRRVIIDKKRALGNNETFENITKTRDPRNNGESNDNKTRQKLDNSTLTNNAMKSQVTRSNSIRSNSAAKVPDRNNSNCSLVSTNKMNSRTSPGSVLLNKRNNNNYASLSGSNLSLSSIGSGDVDVVVKRSNSLFDELASCFEDDDNYSSLRSPLKNDSLSVSSPIVQSNRTRNGQISDEEFSSPDSYKRQDPNKLNVDSAYSSLNRKYSNHGRSANEVAARLDEDTTFRRRDSDGRTSASSNKSKMSKFCHECGSKFPETAKFCCECGIKRLTL